MEGIINIRELAALSHEGADWTEAFRAAVERAHAAGGGVIFVPAGKYPSRSIRLRSRITLYLGSGAEIVFKDDPAEYETLSELAGTEDPANCMHCVYAWREEYVSVKGEGVLNGNGAAWWKTVREKRPLEKGRPNLICFQECDHVRVEGVTLSHVSVTMDPEGEPGKPAMMEGLEKMQSAGFFIRNARDIVFDHVRFENVKGKTIDMDETVQMNARILRDGGAGM